MSVFYATINCIIMSSNGLVFICYGVTGRMLTRASDVMNFEPTCCSSPPPSIQLPCSVSNLPGPHPYFIHTGFYILNNEFRNTFIRIDFNVSLIRYIHFALWCVKMFYQVQLIVLVNAIKNVDVDTYIIITYFYNESA